MRTVTLEILRHGPAHNQLLSPLTQYLALCENHPAVTLRMPVEHRQMLVQLRTLSYQLESNTRSYQLEETARMLGEMLGDIPGLAVSLNDIGIINIDHSALTANTQAGQCGILGAQPTHLRLLLSSSELALLPFELAYVPRGMAGSCQHLLLNPQIPVCITRETRRSPTRYVAWPDTIRILFAYAAPGNAKVPHEAHLLALRRAISPWLPFTGAADNGLSECEQRARREAIERRLVVLQNASVQTLEEHCATGKFTHIHILAHGAKPDEDPDARYGLMLHDSNNSDFAEIVSASRLATILTARGASPTVVTLASCNSSNVGSVEGIGASISHALHEAGIPLIIGSQFPLTFQGSILMVEKLYEGFLRGDDPRRVLVDLRRSLYSRQDSAHDWASLTTYSSFPPDFVQQIKNFGLRQVKGKINAALSEADSLLAKVSAKPEMLTHENFDSVLKRIKQAHREMESYVAQYPEFEDKTKMAGGEKRLAEIYFHLWNAQKKSENEKIIQADEDDYFYKKMILHWQRAKKFYWEARFKQPREVFKTVQYLALAVFLHHMGKGFNTDDLQEHDLTQLWLGAEVGALSERASDDNAKRAWAYCDLVELYLLAPLLPDLIKFKSTQLTSLGLLCSGSDSDPIVIEKNRTKLILDYFAAEAKDSYFQIVRLSGRNSYQNFSTRRQIIRYTSWFFPMLKYLPRDKIKFTYEIIFSSSKATQDLINQIPECDQQEWPDW